MVIFHSYVSLPEGMLLVTVGAILTVSVCLCSASIIDGASRCSWHHGKPDFDQNRGWVDYFQDIVLPGWWIISIKNDHDGNPYRRQRVNMAVDQFIPITSPSIIGDIRLESHKTSPWCWFSSPLIPSVSSNMTSWKLPMKLLMVNSSNKMVDFPIFSSKPCLITRG